MSLDHETARLARESLRAHRLATAAGEVSAVQSPATRDDVTGGITRPTETAALCPRRAHVEDTIRELTPLATALADRLAAALDTWEGHTSA